MIEQILEVVKGVIDMGRFGTPMYSAPQECCCFVTVEFGDNVSIKFWKGSSFKAIREAAKKQYKGSVIQFGNCFWRTL